MLIQHRSVAYWSSKHLSISPVCNFIMGLLNNIKCKYGLISTLLGDERYNYEYEWHCHTQMESHACHAMCRINKLIGLFESLRYSNWRDRDCERFAFFLTLLRLRHREFLPLRRLSFRSLSLRGRREKGRVREEGEKCESGEKGRKRLVFHPPFSELIR